MQFERQIIAGHDLRIARVDRGDRPTVVMTNAFPQSIRCWESLWERLAERFNLLAVDLAGFGLSEGSGPVMRPSAQAQLLKKLMDANGIDQAFIVGPDVGVPVSLWLAADHPERVLGVNIYDGPGTWPTDFAPVLDAAVRFRLVRWFAKRWPMRGSVMRQNFEAATSAGYDHFQPSEVAVAEYRKICFDAAKHRNSLDFLASYREELPQLERRLATIARPVLITWGAQDDFVRSTNAVRLHKLLANSELVIFDNAGHFSHEDADGRWLDAFTSFSTGISAKVQSLSV